MLEFLVQRHLTRLIPPDDEFLHLLGQQPCDVISTIRGHACSLKFWQNGLVTLPKSRGGSWNLHSFRELVGRARQQLVQDLAR